jgi:hypothetical protein
MKILHIVICTCFCASCGGGMHLSLPAADTGWTSRDAETLDGRAMDSAEGVNSVDSQAQVCLLSGGEAIHVPQSHRAVSESCPSERGSMGPIDTTNCESTSEISCKSDADCTAGRNGRCILEDWCLSSCSYDQCLVDTDCPEMQPCYCRSSGEDTLANTCRAGSNCRTDTDCGECGFCSLSVQRDVLHCSSVDGCTEGGCDGGGTATRCTCLTVHSLAYNCHTSNDECTNDTECPLDYCAYMDPTMRWECGSCSYMTRL